MKTKSKKIMVVKFFMLANSTIAVLAFGTKEGGGYKLVVFNDNVAVCKVGEGGIKRVAFLRAIRKV